MSDDVVPKTSTVCVLGNYRCGTTWLAEVIQRGLGPEAAMLFEPIRAYYPPMKEAGVTAWRPVITRQNATPAQAELFRSIFVGTFVDAAARGGREVARTDVEAVRKSRKLVVKMVRGLCSLPWMLKTFPGVRFIVISRHPFAAISSQLQVGAAKGTPKDRAELEPFFAAYPDAVEPFTPKTDEEWLATYWAMSYTGALAAAQPPGRPYPVDLLMRYEELVDANSGWLRRRLREVLNHLVDHDLRPELRSMTDQPNLRPGGKALPPRKPWRDYLSADQQQRIWDVVEHRFEDLAFDLGYSR